MSTKGKTWKWSDEARAAASAKRRGKQPDHLKGQGRKHGLSQTREYNHWKKMMQRCYHETNPDYPLYGGRGIKVVEAWHDVRNFVADMGEVPKVGGRMSIERVDVNGDYGPDNCIWLPLRLQSKNRRPWKHTPAGLKAISESTRQTNLKRRIS